MQKIGDLFGKLPAKSKKSRDTERGDLLDIFLGRLNPSRKAAGYPPLTHSRLGNNLAGIKTPDLYALLSKCNDAERRGYPWSAIFWKEITSEKLQAKSK
jgi:hypothetical protein